ncbi:MAG: hypothetical protein JZD40_03755 [Sulfolobus sp.]|nr:hypothetical protein [Sulfolobus sp.]
MKRVQKMNYLLYLNTRGIIVKVRKVRKMKGVKLIIKKFVIGSLKAKALWGWGVLFILFWGVVGAYLEKPNFGNMPSSYIPLAYKFYVAAWMGTLIVMNIGTIADGLTNTIYYDSGSLPYLFKYSKLKSSHYMVSMMAGSIVVTMIFGAIVTAVGLVFSPRMVRGLQ